MTAQLTLIEGPTGWPRAPEWLRVVREPSQLAAPVPVRAPRDVAELLRKHQAHCEEVEVIYCLMLDAQNNVRGLQEITRGTLNATLVHPREVFRLAILHGAAGIVVAHNHPSGDVHPSAEDKAVTQQLNEAGKLLDMPLYDHVIINDDSYFSFAEAGLL